MLARAELNSTRASILPVLLISLYSQGISLPVKPAAYCQECGSRLVHNSTLTIPVLQNLAEIQKISRRL